MRLLNVHSLTFTEFHEDKRPPYAIASHRWVEGGEVTLQDVQNGWNTNKSGYKKILDFAKYVDKHVPGVEWLWVDTCCINKDSASELSKSLNLMFHWYRDAVLCIAYLADVQAAGDKSAFQQSQWFKRGWTLQELLAPRLVVFVTATWQVIGNKGASTYHDCGTPSGPALEHDIATITGVPTRILHDYAASISLSVEEKFKWMEGRTTTEPEDMSYALYGIFGVTPGANYGERHEGARQRLLAAIHYQDNLSAQRAEQFQKIAAWLSPPDPWSNHESARQLREPQTGSWLLQSTQYQSWKGLSTRHLWLCGKAGCGKTVLCSTVIEDVKAHCQHQPNTGYAVFYFSFSDDRKQRLMDFLLSLVVQLGWKPPALSMLQQAFDRPNRSALGVEELENILYACFEAHSTVFLLLDALDECPEINDIRQSITECLVRLSQKARNLKIFASSRELLDISTFALESLRAQSLAIATQVVDGDVRKYVATQLSRDHRLSRLEERTKRLIEETLCVKSNGMFRWAYCQLQELKKLKITRPSNIEKALATLPADLDETYERILARIDYNTRPDALKLLNWLAYSTTPPSLSELVEAMIVDPTGMGKVDFEDRPGLTDSLEILSGLIITEEESREANLSSYDTQFIESGSPEWETGGEFASDHRQIIKLVRVRFAHFSVQEFLTSKRILEGDVRDFHLESGVGHRFLAQSCLTYLVHYSRSSKKSSRIEDLDVFPLLEYAAKSWFFHSSLQQCEEVTHEVSLLSSRHALENWLLVHEPDKEWKDPFDPFEHLERIESGLYYASFLGLAAVVRALLRVEANVNALGGKNGTALLAASRRGHETIVQILLDAGADVNVQGGYYGSALSGASSAGHEKVVQILLKAGADTKVQGENHITALHTASYGGHEKIVQILLDAGADVNAQGGEYGSALQAACARGNEKVVQVLLDAGADVSAEARRFGNALAAARESPSRAYMLYYRFKTTYREERGKDHDLILQDAKPKKHTRIAALLEEAGALRLDGR